MESCRQILLTSRLTKQSLNLATFFTNLSSPRTFIYSGEATAGPPIYKGCFPTQTAYATAYVAGQTYFAVPNTMIWRSPTNILTVTWQYPNLTLASVAGSVMTLVELEIIFIGIDCRRKPCLVIFLEVDGQCGHPKIENSY